MDVAVRELSVFVMPRNLTYDKSLQQLLGSCSVIVKETSFSSVLSLL